MRVLSVDPADPFLPTLAARLADGTLWPGGLPDDPFALAGATVYLPTRRAARALATAFLAAAPGGATVLPRIEALSDPDEEPEGRPGIMGQLEARTVLARLVSHWASAIRPADPTMRPLVSASGPDTIRLADDLLALMDQVETQEADWADLPGLVERADLAEHWRITTDFLRIATEAWPAHLAAAGRITEAGARRADALAAERRIAGATGPIVVAGSTGSIPATRRLIGAIARSPWGVVVLPGFDRTATAADWDALAEAPDAAGHVQYGMKQLVDALGLAPDDVARLAPPVAAATPPARTAMLAAALRPAPATGGWLQDRAAIDLAAAFDGLALVEAPDERAEAAAIAVAMREAVARGEQVALITPHRALARRVTHHLRHWNMKVDDSGGQPLAGTAAGVLARLLAATATAGGAAEWLALLKHADTALLAEPRAVEEVERLLRGPRIAPARMLDAMEACGENAAALATTLRAAFAPLTALAAAPATVGAFAAAHLAVFEALAAPDIAARAALTAMLTELAPRDELTIAPTDWPATFEALMAGMVVRARALEDAVRILGPLEARLQSFDHAILGGLNEGTWPAAPDAGPWMSRGMMSAFGLDLPERRIGLSAHDVFTAAHQPRVTLTRARKASGEPTVASRWWQRLLAFAGEAAEPAQKRGADLLAYAAMLDERPTVPAATRPCPKPPVAVRPGDFSVSDVSRLVRDPYAIYAKRILKLRPLDPLEQDPAASDRGELFHVVLARFIAEGAHRRPDAEDRFRAIAEDAVRALAFAPEAQALWGARLAALAPYVAAIEAARPAATHRVEATAEARLGDGLVLRGRIDRIDLTPGGAEIIDYKTGSPPSGKQVKAFLEPQLPLEAALIRAGALDDVPADEAITALTYVAIGAGRDPVKWTVVAGDDAGALAEEARERLTALHALYQSPDQGYLSRARPKMESETGDYDHLARLAEWRNA